MAEQRPDLVLLDLMLPDVSGIEVCRRLKGDDATRDIPIVMVTAKGDEVDRVVGFELGADDYVVKPYSLRELLLRVDAVLRRTHAAPTGEPAACWCSASCASIATRTGSGSTSERSTLTALELRLLCHAARAARARAVARPRCSTTSGG